MKIIIAPDKFKGSLSAKHVCEAIAEGIQLADKKAEIIQCPMADGGEGTMQILTEAVGGNIIEMAVKDPLFRPIKSRFGYDAVSKTAFIEMAEASGLPLLKNHERNPLKTTTYGTGELIEAAILRGCQKLVLCIGGSATNDAGIGMAAALGYRFLDKNGKELSPVGENLMRIQRIDDTYSLIKIKKLAVQVACDVSNPLYGKMGAAHIYARQKGATEDMVNQLDDGLQHFNALIKSYKGIDLQTVSGAGAAGGLGGGAIAFLDAKILRGVDVVFEALDFYAKIDNADWVITGEGKIDEQTLHDKLIKGVVEACSKKNIPVAAFCGTLDLSITAQQTLGLHYAVSILNKPMSLAQAIEYAKEGLIQGAFNWAKLVI
jgi:glycerate 2-kinase